MRCAGQWCALPPEFFLDRKLGRRVAEGLRACGWTVHRIGDVSDGSMGTARRSTGPSPGGGPAAYAVRRDRVERTWP